MPLLEVDCKALLGAGKQGKVYLGRLTFDDGSFKLVAAKTVSLENLHGEVKLQRRASPVEKSHENTGVVDSYGVMQARNMNYYHVISLCNFALGSMKNEIVALQRKSAKKRLYLKIVLDFLANTITALETISQAKIVHRDLKPDNFLYDGEWKLGDFGSAADIDLVVAYKIQGSPLFMAPEQVCIDKDLFRLLLVRSDAYALGVTLRLLLDNPLIYIFGDRNLNTENDPISIIYYKFALFSAMHTKCGVSMEENPLRKKLLSKIMRETDHDCKKEIDAWDDRSALAGCIKQFSTWLLRAMPEQRPSLFVLRSALEKLKIIFDQQLADVKISAEELQCDVDAFFADHVIPHEVTGNFEVGADTPESTDSMELWKGSSQVGSVLSHGVSPSPEVERQSPVIDSALQAGFFAEAGASQKDAFVPQFSVPPKMVSLPRK